MTLLKALFCNILGTGIKKLLAIFQSEESKQIDFQGSQ